MTTLGTSLWPRLAELPLRIDAARFERLALDFSPDMERVTTQIHLLGSGMEGVGEDICPYAEEHEALREAGPSLPLAGEWTLEAFSEHLATVEQWPSPPAWEAARRYRNWAFESAALDLALRQAGRPLHELLGRPEPRPVRFVNSLGLGEPPSTDTIHRRLAQCPGLRFKLDAHPAWTPDLIAELAATGAVDAIDFKGHYGEEIEDPEALVSLYDHVLDALPDALLEDPHDLPEVTARLASRLERVSYDAPVHEARALDALPLAAGRVNVKSSRVGSLRALFELYAHCEAWGLGMYGGGMGELGVGRGQVQLLAAVFHPDAPNDVAPGGWNLAEPPAGLPSGPLVPSPRPTGLRWAAGPARE